VMINMRINQLFLKLSWRRPKTVWAHTHTCFVLCHDADLCGLICFNIGLPDFGLGNGLPYDIKLICIQSVPYVKNYKVLFTTM
jgi:hypothetical protein